MTDSKILNLNSGDPFAEDVLGSSNLGTGSADNYIHIRIQQRNGRKTLTTVQGISSFGDYDLRKMVRACKKEYACNGTVVDHPEYGEVMQLQGDQRTSMKEWLVNIKLTKEGNIKVHGF